MFISIDQTLAQWADHRWRRDCLGSFIGYLLSVERSRNAPLALTVRNRATPVGPLLVHQYPAPLPRSGFVLRENDALNLLLLAHRIDLSLHRRRSNQSPHGIACREFSALCVSGNIHSDGQTAPRPSRPDRRQERPMTLGKTNVCFGSNPAV